MRVSPFENIERVWILGQQALGEGVRPGELAQHGVGDALAQCLHQLVLLVGRHVLDHLEDALVVDGVLDPVAAAGRSQVGLELEIQCHRASNAAYGLAWNRDVSAVNWLLNAYAKSGDKNVRGLSLVALATASPAGADPAPTKEGPIKWIENWEDAAKAAKEKGSVVFVYVHRIEPH